MEILKTKPSVPLKLHKVMKDELFNDLNKDLQTLITDECLFDGMKKVDGLKNATTFEKDLKLWYLSVSSINEKLYFKIHHFLGGHQEMSNYT